MVLAQTEPKKIYIRVDQQWWQPWANTLVYYNINDNDTNTTIYDLSWNGYHQTWWWTAAYSTEAGLWRVATFGGTYTQTTSKVNFWNDITLISLVKTTSTADQTVVSQWASSSTWAFWHILNFETGGTYHGVIWSFSWTTNFDNSIVKSAISQLPTNTWKLITTTRDSSWTWKVYIDGVLDNTATLTANPWYTSWENLQIGRWRSWWPKYFYWQFKLFIWENRRWTDQEVADYYNEIKATYWL